MNGADRSWSPGGLALERAHARPRRTWAALALRGALLATLGLLAYAPHARADLSGVVEGRPLFGLDGRYGGGVTADVWGSRGILRPGATFGIAALSAGDGASSRVLTPLALSLALMPRRDESGFVATLRLGGYAGAQKGGFIAGGFGSCTLGYGFGLGEGASVRIAAELWGLLGAHGGLFLGPTIGLGF